MEVKKRSIWEGYAFKGLALIYVIILLMEVRMFMLPFKNIQQLGYSVKSFIDNLAVNVVECLFCDRQYLKM